MDIREQWLEQGVRRLKPLVEEHTDLIVGSVKVSCGWPSRRALSKNKPIGECWHAEDVDKENAQIFISPVICDPVEVLGTLLHEMGHAGLQSSA